ncbi:unnamed protein product [Lota lota]
MLHPLLPQRPMSGALSRVGRRSLLDSIEMEIYAVDMALSRLSMQAPLKPGGVCCDRDGHGDRQADLELEPCLLGH